jgi:tetratricopeptide (TPR) repeat protein
MAHDAAVEALLAEESVPQRYVEAAGFLEKALQVGGADPDVAYMLAMACKRQGKVAEARAALRKISRPDASAWLQMGLLSLREKQLAQAEGEFARAWEMDPSSYPACYNLVMTRLTLGRLDDCRALLPRALELAPTPDEQRYLAVLQALLGSSPAQNGDVPVTTAVAELSFDDEGRLLQLLRGLGQLDVTQELLEKVLAARPDSAAAQEAYAEVVMVKAQALGDRGEWLQAERLLMPLTRFRSLPRAHQTVLCNMLGVACCLNQDFDSGVRHLTQAIKLSGNDARLYQNLALAYELQGQLAQAEPQWNRYFDLLSAGADLPRPPGQPDYHDCLVFEALTRLAARFSERERWAQALNYVQRAARLRPSDPDTLERLFHLYTHLKRTEEARKTLRQLRELRPADPQYDLYELDLAEVKGLGDIDRLLGDVDRILRRYPNDARVEERAVAMVGNVIPLMSDLCDRLTDELNKVVDQIRRLPNYQINWSAVSEVVRDLQREFQRLRKITNRCLPLVTHEEHRRIVRKLADHIDRKIEVCRSILR